MAEARDPHLATALVFAGGDPPSPALPALLPLVALVIGADSGVDHAQALGIDVDLAVGDFDSVTPRALARAEATGARIEAHPAEKDATDLELALDAALAAGVQHIVVVGGHGGRPDHEIANVALFASRRFADVDLEAWFGAAHLVVIRRRASLSGAVGDLVSLLALGGPVTGVTTDGLRYPLRDATLHPDATLGVSNELVAPDATVTITGGVLLAVQPHAVQPHAVQPHAVQSKAVPTPTLGGSD